MQHIIISSTHFFFLRNHANNLAGSLPPRPVYVFLGFEFSGIYLALMSSPSSCPTGVKPTAPGDSPSFGTVPGSAPSFP